MSRPPLAPSSLWRVALACLLGLLARPVLAAEVVAPTASPAAADVARAAAVEAVVYAVFDTTVGPIAVELLPEVAPKTVAQIRRLIELGVYDGVGIFRIHRGFVAQLENARSRPLTSEQLAAIKPIPAELTDVPHRRGVLSMAHGDDPDSAETSFSFLLGNAPHLDGKFTIFGRVLGSEPTLRAIESAAGPDPMQPLQSIAVEHARIVDRATAMETANKPLTFPAGVDPGAAGKQAPRWTLLALTSAVALLALATALAALRTGGRGLISLALATFLCAFFVVFAVLLFDLELFGALRPWIATLLLAVSVLSFKVMGRFDSTGRRPGA
jgi:cyclophilin family peptidyl-prolyl cis-trans isomerase